MAKVIAVNNQKGGVAKTTTCLSLGASLAEMGLTVLVVDLDPQAHLTMSLGIQPEKLHRTIGDVLLGHLSMMSVSRESPVFDLDVAPSNQGLALVDKLLYQQNDYEFRLQKKIRAMDDYYEIIIIDCPPSFNTLTLNALTASDLLIIPIQCEYYAAQSLPRIINLAQKVRQKTNATLAYKLLVTMYDGRNRVCRLIYEQLQESMSDLLYDTIIEIDTKLKESPAFGLPITQYAPETRGARQYRSLAQELMNHYDQ
ncbi:MAG: ParA family protein [Anaerolineae bacterium]|nr:ParA family protein [Anaerolineae bacterium]